jgi:NADPH:quinone reductase-like Zn-dependent oxidoreductase
MNAICLRACGGPEALAYQKAPQPRPGEGEVLVRVHAAGASTVTHRCKNLKPSLATAH